MSERAVYSGVFEIGNVRLPINIYKIQDTFGISASEFHKDCGGKIRYTKRCDKHPDDPTPIIESCILTDSGLKVVDSNVRDELLDRKAPMTYIGNYPLRELAFYQDYFPAEAYRIGVPDVLANSVHTLLESMRKHRIFLLVTVGLSSMKRFAILLPSGILVTLAYTEEIRENPPVFGDTDKNLKADLEAVFSQPRKHLPSFSLILYRRRIAEWLLPPQVTKKPRTNPKKVTDGTKTTKRLSGARS